METLHLKFDDVKATMKYDMNAALDDRGVDGSNYHANNILSAIAEGEHRMLATLELPSATICISIKEGSSSLTIRNEDNEIENIF